MATSVTLPALGESVTEGTVTRWLKQPGEEVQADEPLLEVSTDKVDTEIPSPTSGTLLEIKVAEDETVEVGTELAVIGDPSEGNGSGKPEQPASEKAAASAGATSAGATSAGAEAQPAQPSADASQPADSSPTAGAATSPAQSGPPAAGGSAGGTPVTLPALGESVTEGTVTRWLKQVGEEVQADEPLLEVSTDKVDTEIPSPTSGTLLEIKVAEDETVEVGTELAVIGDPSEGNGSGKPEQPASQKAAASAGATSTGAASAGAEAQPGQPSADASQPADSSPTAGAATSPAQSGPPAAGGSAGAAPVTLPALGESVTEGTVTRWLKQVGEEVQADEPLLEVSTDKVDTEIPSPTSGTLLEIKVAEDETVEVGTELAVIGDPSEGNGGGQPEQPASEAAGAFPPRRGTKPPPSRPPADAPQPADSSQTAGSATSPAQSGPPAAGGGS